MWVPLHEMVRIFARAAENFEITASGPLHEMYKYTFWIRHIIDFRLWRNNSVIFNISGIQPLLPICPVYGHHPFRKHHYASTRNTLVVKMRRNKTHIKPISSKPRKNNFKVNLKSGVSLRPRETQHTQKDPCFICGCTSAHFSINMR